MITSTLQFLSGYGWGLGLNHLSTDLNAIDNEDENFNDLFLNVKRSFYQSTQTFLTLNLIDKTLLITNKAKLSNTIYSITCLSPVLLTIFKGIEYGYDNDEGLFTKLSHNFSYITELALLVNSIALFIFKQYAFASGLLVSISIDLLIPSKDANRSFSNLKASLDTCSSLLNLIRENTVLKTVTIIAYLFPSASS